MEFQTNKSLGKILRNKNLIYSKTYLHSGMNRLTSHECRKRYVRKLQEILTCLVNMCKYFVVKVIIKLEVYESVHRDTTTKITNKMHYID